MYCTTSHVHVDFPGISPQILGWFQGLETAQLEIEPLLSKAEGLAATAPWFCCGDLEKVDWKL